MVEHGLLDDLVGSDQEGLRNCQSQRLGGLEVDDEFEFRWVLDGQIDADLLRLG